jgi:hypothetical protein
MYKRALRTLHCEVRGGRLPGKVCSIAVKLIATETHALMRLVHESRR